MENQIFDELDEKLDNFNTLAKLELIESVIENSENDNDLKETFYELNTESEKSFGIQDTKHNIIFIMSDTCGLHYVRYIMKSGIHEWNFPQDTITVSNEPICYLCATMIKCFDKFDSKYLFPDVLIKNLNSLNDDQNCLRWLKNCKLEDLKNFLQYTNQLCCKVLHMAAALGRLDILLFLHLKGHDISLKDEYGQNPLFYATINEQLFTAILLKILKPMKLFETHDFQTKYLNSTSTKADIDRLIGIIYKAIATYFKALNIIERFENEKKSKKSQ